MVRPTSRSCSGTPRLAVRAAAVALISIALCLVVQTVACADIPAPPLQRLPGREKAKALAALAGLIILGFSLVLLTWLGARITHRYRHGTFYFRPTPRPGEHDWSRKPLTPSDDSSP